MRRRGLRGPSLTLARQRRPVIHRPTERIEHAAQQEIIGHGQRERIHRDRFTTDVQAADIAQRHQ